MNRRYNSSPSQWINANASELRGLPAPEEEWQWSETDLSWSILIQLSDRDAIECVGRASNSAPTKVWKTRQDVWDDLVRTAYMQDIDLEYLEINPSTDGNLVSFYRRLVPHIPSSEIILNDQLTAALGAYLLYHSHSPNVK